MPQKPRPRDFDIDFWLVLSPGRIRGAEPKQLCHALESSTEAAIAAEGELGEVIRVDQILGIVPEAIK